MNGAIRNNLPSEWPNKIFVVVPTYNESKNITLLIERVIGILPEAEIIVADDNSPDGTAEIAREWEKRDHRVHLLFRENERGRGTAGVMGFLYALEHGADIVIEMDADFSHDPKHLPEFVKEIHNCDVVVGSRFVPGGRNIRSGLRRNIVTRLANIYIRLILHTDIRDCTSGYRCFRREVLEALDLTHTISQGPSVVQELLYKSSLLGYRIKEIPITFVDRYRGISSFNIRLALQGFIMVLILRYIFSELRRLNPIELYPPENTKPGSKYQ